MRGFQPKCKKKLGCMLPFAHARLHNLNSMGVSVLRVLFRGGFKGNQKVQHNWEKGVGGGD